MRTTLEVVNTCLSSIGEAPLLELTDDHPLAETAQATLRRVLVQEMSRQWWFNTDYLTLALASDKYVYVPGDAVGVVPVGRSDLTLRGRRLYNRMKGTFEMDGPVQAWVIRLLPFEDLPPPAQAFVETSTVLLFQTEYDADPIKTNQLNMHVQRSELVLNAEHIRQIKANPLLSPEIAQKRLAMGGGRRSNHIPVR
ncbi:tail tubular protein A [Aeromonas phage Atoyac13]|uniref:Tail tubular protein A n=1 Tax=Aeromonas phage Atoyac1 TaxID=2767547 RepID=A0A866D1R6_9CAUD|nr:tail tubular protein A [Aeromonas phage Atoyac1]QOC54230.1 tail tubular protein A [Aeromonas phage Atoyac10]QOC54276.1 tail tubular protein A [Aeromonas phage Atoyac13]QOC54322.1 tail tubular protein A [Aeromonas phage Atoyac14]